MKYKESEEMYLETILRLQKQKGNVRSKELAEALGYAKSSVSRAVNLLKTRGYLTVAEDGELLLTEAGRQKAVNVFERHTVLTKMLLHFGVPQAAAEENACMIEHVITQDVFVAIKAFVDQICES